MLSFPKVGHNLTVPQVRRNPRLPERVCVCGGGVTREAVWGLR